MKRPKMATPRNITRLITSVALGLPKRSSLRRRVSRTGCHSEGDNHIMCVRSLVLRTTLNVLTSRGLLALVCQHGRYKPVFSTGMETLVVPAIINGALS